MGRVQVLIFFAGSGRVSGLILGSKNAIFRVKIAKEILIVGEKFIYKKQQKNMGRIAYVELIWW